MPILGGDLVFGYPGDGGVGNRLIEQVLAGTKTATALPRNECSPSMLRDTLASVGQHVTVVDSAGQPRAQILVKRVFECHLAAPDEQLLQGEGYGSDVSAFIRDHYATADPRAESSLGEAATSLASDLRALPASNRLVVSLHDQLRWSVSEIVAATGMPEAQVNQLLRRGRMMLRRARGASNELSQGVDDLLLIVILFELAASSPLDL